MAAGRTLAGIPDEVPLLTRAASRRCCGQPPRSAFGLHLAFAAERRYVGRAGAVVSRRIQNPCREKRSCRMGAWGELAFDNDTSNDWAYGLEEVNNLTLVESALAELEAIGAEYLDSNVACNALAACEVLARLRGNFGYRNEYTEKVDDWVTEHPTQSEKALLQRAQQAIQRILSQNSELRDLWEEGDDDSWRKSVEDLRQRLTS